MAACIDSIRTQDTNCIWGSIKCVSVTPCKIDADKPRTSNKGGSSRSINVIPPKIVADKPRTSNKSGSSRDLTHHPPPHYHSRFSPLLALPPLAARPDDNTTIFTKDSNRQNSFVRSIIPS